MNPKESHTTVSQAARPIHVYFVNNSNNSRSEFRLGRYLAERLPCLQALPGHGRRAGGLWWDAEKLGPIEPFDVQTFRALDQPDLPSREFSPEATVKDAIFSLGKWIIETVRARLPQHMVEAIARWLRDQWARYIPESVLEQCDWEDYFWQCISLPDNVRLLAGGQDYGVLPCLAGRIEVHPAGVNAGSEVDINWQWRHEEIEQKKEIERKNADPHPQDSNRTRYIFANFFTPAHLCDTLEYCFSEIRHVHDPVDGWRTDADGSPIRRYERMDDIPHLLVHFHRGGHAATWLTQTHDGANHLYEPTDHWVIRDQELLESLAMQRISEAMPHFVYQTLAMRLCPVLDSFRRHARNMVEASGALPYPVWLRTGPLRGTLDDAEQEARSHRVHKYDEQEVMFYTDHLSTDHPQSNSLWRALHWLKSQQPQGDVPIGEMTSIDWQSRILVVADLADQVRELPAQRRQALVEAHRQLTGLFEGLLRTFFSHTSFNERSQNTPRTPFSILFCEWVAQQDNRATNNSHHSHNWYSIFSPGIIDAKFAWAPGSPRPRLTEILLCIAKSAAELTGDVQPGEFVHEMLSTSQNDVGACAWTRRLVAACRLRLDGSGGRPEDRTVANLLMIGLILIKTRNHLTHGQVPLEVECPEGGVIVTSHRDGESVILDAKSLEMCFRLFVAAATLVIVVGGLNPRRLDDRDRNLTEKDRQAEQARIDRDTTERDLFLRFY